MTTVHHLRSYYTPEEVEVFIHTLNRSLPDVDDDELRERLALFVFDCGLIMRRVAQLGLVDVDDLPGGAA